MKTYGWLMGLLASVALAAAEEPGQRVIVCSTTQTADFARQVVGDRWKVVSILAPGADPHLYEIKPADAKLVASADLCVQNGLHLEGGDWMKKLVKDARKPLVNCTDGVQQLTLAEDGGSVPDPHAWFTPANAATYVKNILKGVVKVDPDHKDEYEARAGLYLEELRILHQWVQKQFNDVPPHRRVLVTSHDAFNYFCEAYGFKSRAPVGWSTGSEIGGGMSPDRRKLVVDSIKSFNVPAIFVETSVNPKLIRELASEAGVRIGGELYSDSMGPPGSAGETYIGMMRENTLIIKQALK